MTSEKTSATSPLFCNHLHMLPKAMQNAQTLHVTWSKIETGFYCAKIAFQGKTKRLIPSYSLAYAQSLSYRFVAKDARGWHSLHPIGNAEPITHKDIAKSLNISAQEITPDPQTDFFDGLKATEKLVLFIRSAETLKTLEQGMITLTCDLKAQTSQKLTSQNLDLPPISQYETDPENGHRICLAVSTTMVMQYLGCTVPPTHIRDALYDPVLAAQGFEFPYGIWPNAVQAGNTYGLSGFVTTIKNWDTVAHLLNDDIPIIVSVSYGEGELSDGAISKTRGHIMVISGLDGEKVFVHDPAGKAANEVRRSYDRTEFQKSWWRNRNGAAIILFRHCEEF